MSSYIGIYILYTKEKLLISPESNILWQVYQNDFKRVYPN